MPVQLTCIGCQKLFLVSAYQADSKKYCTQECRSEHNRITLTCECCGEPYWVFKSAIKYHSKRFCSMKCRKAVMGRKPVEKVPREVVIKVCKTCGIEFRVPPVRKETAKYCSQKCKGADPEYQLESSKAQRLEKSAIFSGGVSVNSGGYMKQKDWGEKTPIYTTQHRIIMAEAIAKECKTHPFLVEIEGVLRLRPEIHVHHIDRDKLNNNLSNLLAVTASAHVKLHRNGRKPDPWECYPANPVNW